MISALLLLAALSLAQPPDACSGSAAREAALELAVPLTARWEGLAKCVGPRADRCSIVTAYPDPGVGVELPTIGYGTTSLSVSRVRVVMGMRITRSEAAAMLRTELSVVASEVCRTVSRRPLSPPQLAALSSFSYNLGIGTLRKSRERGLLSHVNAGRDSSAAAVMRRYIYAGGRKLPGLQKRRDAEAAMYLSGPGP